MDSYLETPIVLSSLLALCQRKHVRADKLKNVASAGINRTESGDRSVAICVVAICGPAGMKPAETFLETSLEITRGSGKKLIKLQTSQLQS